MKQNYIVPVANNTCNSSRKNVTNTFISVSLAVQLDEKAVELYFALVFVRLIQYKI